MTCKHCDLEYEALHTVENCLARVTIQRNDAQKRIIALETEFLDWRDLVTENLLSIIVGEHRFSDTVSDAILLFDRGTEEWVIVTADKELWRGNEPGEELAKRGWFNPYNKEIA